VIDVPPSGHVTGIYARVDSIRGVHKAPANEIVRGAINVTHAVTSKEQAGLNPHGVNCIRAFTSRGILVWGARTLSSPASEFRYVNVRRTTIMIEESIRDATRWVVFEPNDAKLWKAIRASVGDFLTSLWRTGALVGAKPEQAFFVRCDRETNPLERVEQGKVTFLVGVASTKPAEFTVLQFAQVAAKLQCSFVLLLNFILFVAQNRGGGKRLWRDELIVLLGR